MKEETLKVTFIKYIEDRNEMLAVNMKNDKEIRVDPFVGCAFDYKYAELLLGKTYKTTGIWHSKLDVFIPTEGQFNLIQ